MNPIQPYNGLVAAPARAGLLSRKNLSRLMLLVLLFIAVFYIAGHKEEFQAIRNIHPAFLLPIVLSVLLQNGVNGYMNKEFVRYFQVDLVFSEWFGLAVVGAMGNYLAPFRGGAAGRAVYLKKKHHLPYTRFMTLFIAGYLVIFFWGGLLGALTMLGLYLTQGFFNGRLFGVFITLSLVVVLFIVFFSRIRLPEGKIWGKISEAITGWKIISGNTAILWRICGAVILNYLLMTVQMYYAFIAFDFSITLTAAWFLSLFSALALFLSVTPGNIGIQEALVGFLAALFGAGFNQGVIAQGLIRAVNMAIIFSLGPIFSYILSRKFPASPSPPEQAERH